MLQKRAAIEAEVTAAEVPPPLDPWTAALQQYAAPAPPPAPHVAPTAPLPPYRGPTLFDSMQHYFVIGIGMSLAFALVRAILG